MYSHRDASRLPPDDCRPERSPIGTFKPSETGKEDSTSNGPSIQDGFWYDGNMDNEMNVGRSAIEYRIPEGKDAEALLSYLKKVGGESDNLSFGKEGLPLTVEQERKLLSSLNTDEHLFLTAFLVDGTVVGSIDLLKGRRRMAHAAEMGISVIREYWGKGVASTLLGEGILWAKAHGVTKVNLSVRADNLRGRAFYRKHGFVKEGDNRMMFMIDDTPIDGEYWGLMLD